MNATSQNISMRDALLALAVIASWGFNIAIIRIGALEMPPLFLLSMRFFLCILIFAPFAKRVDAAMVKNVIIYASLYVVAHLGLLFMGAQYISASLVGLILQMGPAFALILGFWFHNERFGLKTTIGIILSFIGVFMILYQPGAHFSIFGAILILLSAFCWVAGSLRMRQVQNLDLATMTFISHVFAAPIILILSFLLEDGQIESISTANWNWVGFILIYQVLAMSYALYLWKELMRRNPVHQLTGFLVMQPLFVVLFGAALLGEMLNTHEIMGGAVLLAGVVIIVVRKMQKKQVLTEDL